MYTNIYIFETNNFTIIHIKKKIYKATVTIKINFLLKLLVIFVNKMLHNSMNWISKKMY